MAEAFLHLGDIGLMQERVGGRRGAQQMHAQTILLRRRRRYRGRIQDDIAVDRVGIERLLQLLGAVVRDRAERRAGGASSSLHAWASPSAGVLPSL